MSSSLGRIGPDTEAMPPGVYDPMKQVLADQRTLHSMLCGCVGRPYDAQFHARVYVDYCFGVMAARDKQAKIPFCPVLDAYPPCTTPVDQLKKIKLADLSIGVRANDCVIVGRLYRPCSQSWARLVFAIEDDVGASCIATLEFHRRDVINEASMPTGTLVAIAQPCLRIESLYPKFTSLEEAKKNDTFVVLRIDHPTDLRVLNGTDGIVGAKFAKEWKPPLEANLCRIGGNAALSMPMLYSALRMYTDGLSGVGDDQIELKGNLLRNRAQVNLLLLQFDAARSDALESIVFTVGDDNRAAMLKSKALYRAATAAYQLRNFDAAKSDLDEMLLLTPDDMAGSTLLAKTSKRIAERDHGSYDFAAIRKNCTKGGDMDVADFLRRTRLGKSPGRGNGLFANEAISANDIIMVEKAYAAALPTDKNTIPANRLYQKLDDGGNMLDMNIDSDRNASLVKNVVDKLHRNPSTAPGITDLYSRDYPKLAQGAYRDIFLIDKIIRSNAVNITGTMVEGYTRSGNPGLWRQFSYINHSCVPNACIAFSGDVMIIRAQRNIGKDEEITLSYMDPSASFETDSFMLTHNFKFVCDCVLCSAERKTTPEDRKRRSELQAQAPPMPSLLIANKSSTKSSLHAQLKQTAMFRDDLQGTFDSKLFPPGTPRRGLANVHSKISSLYYQLGAREPGALDMAMAAGEAALQSLGYHIHVSKIGGVDFRNDHGIDHGIAEILLMQLETIANARRQQGAVFREIATNVHLLGSVDPKGQGIPDYGQHADSMEKALQMLKMNGL